MELDLHRQPLGDHFGTGVAIQRDDAPFGLTPLTASPIPGGSYDDIGPLNGTLYRYQLRCLAKQGDTIVDSPPSAVVTVTPQPE